MYGLPVRKQPQAVRTAHFRSGDHKKPPAPLSPEIRSLHELQTLDAIRESTAKLRGANRHQNCSGDVGVFSETS